MERSADHVIQAMVDIELAAEEVISDKEQIIALDRRRQKTREAIRAVQKCRDVKTWMCFGNTFLKIPTSSASSILKKDFNLLDEEINDVRKNMKPKVQKLYDLEDKGMLQGFSLNPLSRDDLLALKNT